MEQVIFVEEIVESVEYKECLRQEILSLINERKPGVRYKRSPFDTLIGNWSVSQSVENFISEFKLILEKSSKRSSTERVYIKSTCDLALRKWIAEKIQPSSVEEKIVEA